LGSEEEGEEEEEEEEEEEKFSPLGAAPGPASSWYQPVVGNPLRIPQHPVGVP
jgi:hypothetical protein